jgi:hypothetical protein
MKNLSKFQNKNPKNKEEKLIVELIKNLDEVTHAFLQLNHKGNITQEMFVILRDASIGYAGAMVRDLAKLIDDQNQQMLFLDEAKEIYNCYIEDLKE